MWDNFLCKQQHPFPIKGPIHEKRTCPQCGSKYRKFGFLSCDLVSLAIPVHPKINNPITACHSTGLVRDKSSSPNDHYVSLVCRINKVSMFCWTGGCREKQTFRQFLSCRATIHLPCHQSNQSFIR
jgi:hypothetical protein